MLYLLHLFVILFIIFISIATPRALWEEDEQWGKGIIHPTTVAHFMLLLQLSANPAYYKSIPPTTAV